MGIDQHLLFLNDGLGGPGCADGPECERFVFDLRQGFLNYALTKRLFLSYGVGEALRLPPEVRESGVHAVAALDLDRFQAIDDALDAARAITAKKGRVTREVDRARRKGYVARPFPWALHVPDIHAIHHSKPIRDGRPMAARYLKSLDEMGGAPAGPIDLVAPPCPRHHDEAWGVFEPSPGHRQGAVTTDARLVGYIRLRRVGDTAWYRRILGHGDHLNDGIMYLLHFELLRHCLERRPPGLRHLLYHHWRDPRGDTQNTWKRRCLFEPRWVAMETDRPWVAGDDGATPTDPEKAAAVDAVLAGDPSPFGTRGPAAVDRWCRARMLGGTASGFTFEAGQTPTLDDLLRLRTRDFPKGALAGIASATVLGPPRAFGIETLSHLAAAGMATVVVAGPAESLSAIYPTSWTFGAPSPADLAIIDEPDSGTVLDRLPEAAGLAARRLMVGLRRSTLNILGLPADGHARPGGPEVARALRNRLGLALGDPRLTYRHRRDEGTYWFTGETGG